VSGTTQPLRHVEHCMGTVFSIDIRDTGIDATAVERAVAWLHHVDATFSTYHADSDISRLARHELRLEDCTDEIREVFDRSEQLRAETDGFFDIHAGGRLDPSGYVKGWAIERAADLLAAAGSHNHCINGGGDVQCQGRPDPARPWTVGIADPLRPGELVASVQGGDRLAVATSGTAERGQHVLDPHTGEPVAALASVTVIGRDLADVDAYATAAFAMGPGAASWLAARPDLSAIVVTLDGEVQRISSPARGCNSAASAPA
jgi:thiamine biosynthesis lipoprotein